MYNFRHPVYNVMYASTTGAECVTYTGGISKHLVQVHLLMYCTCLKYFYFTYLFPFDVTLYFSAVFQGEILSFLHCLLRTTAIVILLIKTIQRKHMIIYCLGDINSLI